MSGKILSVVNRKGGVGKTSMVFHLAGHFAETGQKVLIIDNDPQHSLTTGIFGSKHAESLPGENTITALFDDRYDPSPDVVIRETPFPNLKIVSGSDALSQFNLPAPQKAGALQFALREFVEEIRGDFELILIDNPPNIQLCTWASLSAADFALCISQPEDYGSQGCLAVQRAIDDVLRTTNPQLRLAGYLLNLVNRRLSIHNAYEHLLRERYGDKVLQTKIPLLTLFKEAVAARKPITHYKPKSVAAESTRELGKELTERMDVLSLGKPGFQIVSNRSSADPETLRLPELV